MDSGSRLILGAPGQRSRPLPTQVGRPLISSKHHILIRSLGTYIPDPTDSSGYNSDKIGLFHTLYVISINYLQNEQEFHGLLSTKLPDRRVLLLQESSLVLLARVQTMFLSPTTVAVHVSCYINVRQSCSKLLEGSAVAGQNTTFLPHKGVLSPVEKVLYVSYSDGAGPVSFKLSIVNEIDPFNPVRWHFGLHLQIQHHLWRL